MKVIFLDIDGVVRLNGKFNQELLYWVRELCDSCNLRLVISSDWRYQDIQFIKTCIGKLGQYLLKDWRTTIHEDNTELIINPKRWEEVQDYLDTHDDITDYVILDDLPELFEGCPTEMKERLIICDGGLGVSPKNLMVAKAIFDGENRDKN